MADAPMRPPPDPGMLAWPRHTERLVLRPITMEDVDVAATYRGDPQVTRHLRHGCLTREQVVERHRERVRRMAPGAPDPMLGLAIEREGRMVGDCMLDLCRDEAGWYGRIGYALVRSAQGRGFGTDVARELVAIARELRLPRVVATTRPANIASQRVLGRAGLTLLPGRGDAISLLFGLDLRSGSTWSTTASNG